MLIRRVVLCSLLTGVLAGLLMAVIQQIEILPLIHTGESLEASLHLQDTNHSSLASPPADRSLRHIQTLLSSVVTAIGYALVTITAMFGHNLLSQRQPVTAGSGLAWGALGFWVFFANPCLVLPPQTPAYDMLQAQHDGLLAHQQLLWLGISLGTAAAVALAYYGKRTTTRLLALLIACLPALMAALSADSQAASNLRLPEGRFISHLEDNFILAATLTNLLFWLFIGSTCAAVTARERIWQQIKTPRPSA